MASEDLFRRRPKGFFAVSLLDNFVVKQVAAQVVHVFVGVRRSEVAVDGVGLGFTVQVGSCGTAATTSRQPTTAATLWKRQWQNLST